MQFIETIASRKCLQNNSSKNPKINFINKILFIKFLFLSAERIWSTLNLAFFEISVMKIFLKVLTSSTSLQFFLILGFVDTG